MLPAFGFRVSVTFHLMFVHNTFSSVYVVEWPLFLKELPIRLAVYSHFICLFVILVISRFGFESGIRFLIVPVPVHCLRVTLKMVVFNSER